MKKSYNKSVLIVAILTIASKIVAVLRQIVLTYCFGASSITDAYILSQSIPNTLFLLIGTAISVSFIPIFNQVRKEKGENHAELFTTKVINAVIVLASVLIILTLVFSRQIKKAPSTQTMPLYRLFAETWNSYCQIFRRYDEKTRCQCHSALVGALKK